MIIRPKQKLDEDDEYITNKFGFKIKTGSNIESSLSKHRFAVNGNSIREESLLILPKKKLMVKEISIGSLSLDYGSILGRPYYPGNRCRVVHDLSSGKLIEWGVSSELPSNSGHKSDQLLGFISDLNPIKQIRHSNDIYCTKYIEPITNYYDIEHVANSLYSVEDSLQLPYNEFIGLLNSFFSQWTFDLPFECTVILDSKLGFTIKHFKYLKGIIDYDIMIKRAGEFVKQLDKLSDLFKRNSENWNRSLRVTVFIGAFCSIVRLHDNEHKAITLNSTISGCNHFESVIMNTANNPDDYPFSEEAGLLLKTKFGNITDEIMSSINYLSDESLYI